MRLIYFLRFLTVACSAGAASTAASPANAQDGFFFKPPAATVELRIGRNAANASGEIFRHMIDNFTLDSHDFAATSISADVAFRGAPAWDVVLGIAHAISRAASESRDYTDQDDQPILQQTRLTRMPVTAGARYYVLARGQALAEHAWVPARFTPFVGAGVGLMHYRLEQMGDFVNYEDLSIFNDLLESTGNSAMAYGEAGAAYWFNQRVGLSGGARYTYAKAGLRRDFEGFEDINLSGLQASAGFAVRF
ncbi:MAG: hypothetical protein ABIV28_02545 [Longimicrobiales bacterium]